MAKVVIVKVAQVEKAVSFLVQFEKHTFRSGIRILAYMLRYVARAWNARLDSNVRPQRWQCFDTEEVHTEEFEIAKVVALKIMQREAFLKELSLLQKGKAIKTSSYAQLGLFIDEQGIIRCKGRLEHMLVPDILNAPILVDPEDPLIIAFINNLHICANCTSKNYTLHRVRHEMHGPKLKKKVYGIVSAILVSI